MSERTDKPEKEFEERVVSIDRVSRTVKGGKRMRFRALVVVGNRNGRVGMGIGKANDVQGSIQKAVRQAKDRLIDVLIVNETIPHAITHKYGSALIFLKPAPAGTSIIAGGAVRAVVELAGIRNVLSKIIGSSNNINNVRATLETLQKLKTAPATSRQAPRTASGPAPKEAA
ncbi:30S ribosomal protein S5 [Candidatus Berkelbacteria bacterium]|nr:30S ribosomal protein S5 [Candidatus Berkelbacteria bacterium]